MMYLIMVAYARAVGLSREEASILWEILADKGYPTSVDHAWLLLDDALQTIRDERTHDE